MFDTTMFEYSRQPMLLDQVYNDVLMKLNIMLDENDNARMRISVNQKSSKHYPES